MGNARGRRVDPVAQELLQKPRRHVIKAAWLAWQVTRQCGGDHEVMTQPDPPGWFKSYELGLSYEPGAGPSIFYTIENVASDNAARQKQEIEAQRPKKALRTRSRERRPTSAQCQRTVRRALAAAGVLVHNGRYVDQRPCRMRFADGRSCTRSRGHEGAPHRGTA